MHGLAPLAVMVIYLERFGFFVCNYHRRRHWSYLIKRWLPMLINVVVEGGGMRQFEYSNGGGVCTCRHSDAQISKRSKWGFREKINYTLGTTMSPLFIEVGVCRAIVRHTCVRRLRIRRKCNCQREIRRNVEKDVTVNLNWSLFAPSTPSWGRGVFRVITSNIEFWL